MSVLTRSGEAPKVSPTDFGDHDDRPVGQVLSRFAEQRYGESVAEPLTLAQLNLARSFESRASKVFQSPHLLELAVSGHAPGMHLEVAGRYLPLKVDTSFGRYGLVEAQDLIPSGGWTYRLDADLLRLWIEEEAREVTSLWATELASASPDVQQARPSAPRPLAAAAERGVARRIPAPIRRAVAPQRQKLRAAMLQAARGDTSALSAMLSGDQVRRVLDKLGATAAEPRAAGEAPARPATVLDPVALRALVHELPTLSVDASAQSFDFGETAEDLIASVRRGARRQITSRTETPRAPTASEVARHPGLLASVAENQARNTASRMARMFAPSEVEIAAAESRRLSDAGLPVLGEVAARDTLTGGSYASPLSDRLEALGFSGAGDRGKVKPFTPALRAEAHRSRAAGERSDTADPAAATLATLGDSLVTGLSLSDGDQTGLETLFGFTLDRASRALDTPFGTQSLQALGLAWTGESSDASARAYLAYGGRGVLVQPEGYDSSSRGLWGAPTTAYPGGLASHHDQPRTPDSGRAAQLSLDLASIVARFARAGQTQVAAPTIAGTQRAGYDATDLGDFAQVLSTSLVRTGPAARQLEPVQLRSERSVPLAVDGAMAESRGPAAAARRPLGLEESATASVARAPDVRLQDVVVSRKYLRALSTSVDQVLRAAAFFERLAPASLVSGSAATVARRSDPLARHRERALQISASLAQVARVAARIEDGGDSETIRTRTSELAANVAQLIRDSYEMPARFMGESRSGYVGWGADSVFVAGDSGESSRSLWGGRTVERQIQAPVDQGVLERAIARAITEAKAREIADVKQLVAQARRAHTPAPRRSLELFSAEKTLALIAPQLESGGLLDSQSRQELSEAVKALARPETISGAARRVRTPFGTLSVKVVDGRLVVDAEEISSNAPGVGFERALTDRHGPTNAPTRQMHQLAELNAPKPLVAGQIPEAYAPRSFRPGTLATTVEAQVARGRQSTAGTAVARGIEVALGKVSRAERMAGVELDPLVQRRPGEDAESVAARLRLGRPQASEPTTIVRGGAAGDLIAVVAKSSRSSQISQAMARAGLSLPWQALADGIAAGDPGALSTLYAAGVSPARLAAGDSAVLAKLHSAGFDQGAIARLREVARSGGSIARVLGSEVVDEANVAEAISRLVERKERFAAASRRALDVANLEGADSTLLGAAHREMELKALGGMLARAEESRGAGSLGMVGMARPSFGYFDRADMAYILPYMQRTAGGWDRVVRRGLDHGDEPSAGPQRLSAETMVSTLASLDPGTVLELGLSVGRGGNLLGAARSLGLSDHVISVLEAGTEAGLQLPTLLGIDSSPKGFVASSSLAWQSPDRAFVAAGGSRRPSDTWAALRLQAIDRSVQATMDRAEAAQRSRRDDIARRATPQSLRGSIFQKLAEVDGALAEFALKKPSMGRGLAGPGHSALFHGAVGLPGEFVGTGRRGSGPSLWPGATIDTLGEAPSSQRLRAAEAAVASEAERVSKVGVTGIWMPSGVEKLTGASADVMMRPGHRLDGTLVAPKVFSARRSHSSTWGEAKADPASAPAVPAIRLRASELERIAHGMALGLSTFSASARGRSQDGYHHQGGRGDVVTMTVGRRRLASSMWMESTTSQEGAAALMEFLGIDHGGTLPPREAPVPHHQHTLVGLPRQPQEIRGALVNAPSYPSQPAQAAGPKRGVTRPVTSVPTKLTPGYGGKDFAGEREMFSPFSAPGQAGMGMTPLASKGGSTGQVETAQTENRGEHAHQSGTPPLEAIEDTAIEIYEIIQRRWALELERRGVE